MLIYESLLLTIIGFFIGIGLSRLSLIFISKIMDANFNYSLNNTGVLNDEWWLLTVSIIIGLVACLIPSVQVYRMDISKTLSDE